MCARVCVHLCVHVCVCVCALTCTLPDVDGYDYDTVYDWMAGAELNVPKYAARPLTYAPYNHTSRIIVYPSVFVHRHQLWHFLAYARGAAQQLTPTVPNET